MSDIAFVAAPRICPPGARAKVSILFLYRPLACTESVLRELHTCAPQKQKGEISVEMGCWLDVEAVHCVPWGRAAYGIVMP